jgi:hypothetical protein
MDFRFTFGELRFAAVQIRDFRFQIADHRFRAESPAYFSLMAKPRVEIRLGYIYRPERAG